MWEVHVLLNQTQPSLLLHRQQSISGRTSRILPQYTPLTRQSDQSGLGSLTQGAVSTAVPVRRESCLSNAQGALGAEQAPYG